MDLEVEIPIWFNGKMKWISNLTSRSTCSDVVRAILATDGRKSCSADANYHLYECWRGVERPLKSRCRLLKLWHSWAGECGNVTLTLRTQASSSPSTHLLVRQQEKRLERFQRQVKRTDKQLEKLTDNQHCVASEHHQSLITYSNLSRSIIQTTHQLERQEKQIARLIGQIELETRTEWNEEELTRILTDVNQTLIVSRELNEQSDELDGEIHRTNEEIDRKQYLLDELELDDALDQNIDLDSLDDDEDQRTSTLRFAHERVSNKDLSPSPPVLPQKFKTGKQART